MNSEMVLLNRKAFQPKRVTGKQVETLASGINQLFLQFVANVSTGLHKSMRRTVKYSTFFMLKRSSTICAAASLAKT